MRITVLGSGGWGTALALLLTDNGHKVTLWSHRAQDVSQRASYTRPLSGQVMSSLFGFVSGGGVQLFACSFTSWRAL